MNRTAVDPQPAPKFRALFALLGRFYQGGHKALIFASQNRPLEKVKQMIRLHHPEYTYGELNGATKREDADNVKELFKTAPFTELFLLLINTNSGGAGSNLTAADRVVILDPSWSALDEQVRLPRCPLCLPDPLTLTSLGTRPRLSYRPGQECDHLPPEHGRLCRRARLSQAGRQDRRLSHGFRERSRRRVDEDPLQVPHYPFIRLPLSLISCISKDEMAEMTVLENGGQSSRTQQQFAAVATPFAEAGEFGQEEQAFLLSLPEVSGVSDHQLLYSEDIAIQVAISDALENKAAPRERPGPPVITSAVVAKLQADDRELAGLVKRAQKELQ